jgi:Amt family ammonium transporter
MALWSLLVYCPIAHWCWSSNGFLAQKGVLDFAGGYVVHMSSGFSALVIAIMLSKSKKLSTPADGGNGYDPQMLIIGTTLLWFGWFGFNSGSALASNQLASWAFATTFIGSAVCMATWCLLEYLTTKKITIIGACCGSVCGLVAITPASGYVNIEASMIIGIITAIGAMSAQKIIKKMCKIDDTLDVFSCHGIAGLIGSIATGIFATSTINPAITKQGAIYGSYELLLANCEAALIVAVYSIICTLIIYHIVRLFDKIVTD